MVKARKSTWRSGSGWWDSPSVSEGGYTGHEVTSPSGEQKDPLKKRKRPRFKSEKDKALAAKELPRVQKLALRARSNLIAHPEEAARICREALKIRPKAVLSNRDRSGKTYLRVFTELLEDAERSAARKQSLSPRAPKPRGNKR